ncbi:efflux RND transporter permease subunit [Motiliproteus sp. MSK22-1]|uniref:efflux RND transporter permease subunit n=1 Tax=Motiliproteus sp. MSK22-1 TaxID=1897630 RepID=UPI00097612CF|nr:multidrug efflux RND transporter permease subunit [Motiliproteus sp. MSK22-1]OMH28011.1 RND transporter [Motiliproteus sp. MSK22-1]
MFSLFFINRPKFALVISIVLMIAGTLAAFTLPVAQFPDITPPKVQVKASYPGANAEVVEQAVAAPIEGQVNGVDSMLYMSSTSSNDGSYTLDITFAVGTDPDQAAINVQNRVALAEASLPQEVVRQGVTTKKQATNMLLVVNLFSPEGTYDELFLSNYATLNIQDALARINGVGSASQFSPLDYGMRIWLDPDRLKALKLSPGDVSNAIKQQNIQASVGIIGQPPLTQSQQFQYNLRAKGRLETVAEFEDIVLRIGDSAATVRLRDVARIELGSQTYSASSLLNGNSAATVAIYQSPGANALDVANQVYAELEHLSQRFPDDLEYAVLYDTTLSVKASLQEVVETLFITFSLVVIVTFLFLADWRATLIPAATIPVSLIATFAVLKMLGFSINTISLFALILAIGIVVDDAIVVVENVKRHMQEGKLAAAEATSKAMKEVIGPVIATTLVLLAVFVPVAFMPGITGKLYTEFAVTISVAVCFSSLNALTLSPALCALLLKPETQTKGIFKKFDQLVDWTRRGYVKQVSFLNRKLTLSIGLLIAMAAGVYYMFTTTPTGFLPYEDNGAFFINVQLPDGASLNRTDEVIRQIDQILVEQKGVENRIAVKGFSILGGAAPNAALAIPVLDHWDERTDKELAWYNILGELNGKLATIPGANIMAFPTPPIPGLGTAGGLEANLLDLNNGSPQELAQAVRSLIIAANQAPEFSRVYSTYSANVPQLELVVDRDKALSLGIPMSELFSTLQAQLGTQYVNDFNIYGRNYRVIVQADSEFRDDIDDIGHIHVLSNQGYMVPVNALVDIKPVLGPQSLTRFNQTRSASIQAMLAANVATGEGIQILEKLAREALPEGYELQWTGTTSQEQEASGFVILIMSLAVLFAYLFLVAQYESWTIPLAVMLSITIALLGAILPLWLIPGLTNNLYAQIGIVMLIGLASKSAILIVEFAKQLREEGKGIIEAATEAASLRYRAVLMTAFSFILGVMPLVFASGAGAASRISIGFVVLCGMLMATCIGIFFIPALFVTMQTLREKVKKEG